MITNSLSTKDKMVSIANKSIGRLRDLKSNQTPGAGQWVRFNFSELCKKKAPKCIFFLLWRVSVTRKWL